jgi:hypothetical protein
MSLAIHGTSARPKPGEPSSSVGQAANRQNAVSKEALSRLLTLDIGELRQQWRGLYKTQAPRHFSRELLVRAVAFRILARGGPVADSRGDRAFWRASLGRAGTLTRSSRNVGYGSFPAVPARQWHGRSTPISGPPNSSKLT